MTEKTKSLIGSIATFIAVFTFGIPVIPVVGYLTYNHVHPQSSINKTTSSENTSSSSGSDEVDQYQAEQVQQKYEDDRAAEDAALQEQLQSDATDAADSSSGGYVNTYGNYVESPDDNSVGASAQCVDGTYSHSQSRRGTCSYHGGVSSWR